MSLFLSPFLPISSFVSSIGFESDSCCFDAIAAVVAAAEEKDAFKYVRIQVHVVTCMQCPSIVGGSNVVLHYAVRTYELSEPP